MINVIVLVKDRPRLTYQCIQSLVENTETEITVVIVDSDSKSETREIIREWVHAFPTSVASISLHQSNEVAGQNLNLGAYWAEKYWERGKYLYFSGNDMYFTEGWDEKMLVEWEHLHSFFKILGGSTHPYHKPNQIYPGYAEDTQIHTHDAVAGCSHMMRWETWDKYGPYDAHAPGIQQSEDWKLCNDIVQDGGLVGTVFPNVVYDCGLTTTFGEVALGADEKQRYEGVIQE